MRDESEIIAEEYEETFDFNKVVKEDYERKDGSDSINERNDVDNIDDDNLKYHDNGYSIQMTPAKVKIEFN